MPTSFAVLARCRRRFVDGETTRGWTRAPQAARRWCDGPQSVDQALCYGWTPDIGTLGIGGPLLAGPRKRFVRLSLWEGGKNLRFW
jgi:hypothetical protein